MDSLYSVIHPISLLLQKYYFRKKAENECYHVINKHLQFENIFGMIALPVIPKLVPYFVILSEKSCSIVVVSVYVDQHMVKNTFYRDKIDLQKFSI